jgi:hypothetical protein
MSRAVIPPVLSEKQAKTHEMPCLQRRLKFIVVDLALKAELSNFH